MASNENRLTFAPIGIIRAAAWPIESISGFGDSSLAALALRVHSSREPVWRQYLQTYEQTLQREREILWRITAEDVRFMKALLLSNPSVANRVRRSAPKRRGERTKSIRHLENVLYRFLARGAGRTTPHGLWAGVGLIDLGQHQRQRPAATQYSFSPDLRPFQAILRSLARQSRYRDHTRWHANPTLTRRTDGSWRFWVRTGDGKVERREVESDPIVDLLIEAVAGLESATFEEILAAALPRHAESTSAWKACKRPGLLDLFCDSGVLLGGLDLPNRFESAWHALSAIEHYLFPHDRCAWNHAVHELSRLCDKLSTGLKEMTLNALESHLERAVCCVGQLAKTLEVSLPALPNPLLRCDLSLPFRLEFDRQQQAVLLQALQSYESGWIKGLNPIAGFRSEYRRQVEQQIGTGLELGDLTLDSGLNGLNSTTATRVWVELVARCNPEASPRLGAWERLVLAEKPEVLFELPPGLQPTPLAQAPLGCLYVGLFEDFQLVLHGAGDDPGGTLTRHFKLLEPQALEVWLRQCVAGLSSRCGIEIAELQGPFEQNPNVLARPDFGALPIELWGSATTSTRLIGGKLVVDPTTHLPLLRLPSIDKPIAVFWFSAADIANGDPVSAGLLCTSFQESSSFGFRASTIPVREEVDFPRFSPRIRLPGGAIMRPRRTILAGSALEDLARASAAERYARWQRLAAQFQWPALLNLQRDTEPPLLMHRDSPLALESLFKGIRDHIESLTIEEVVGAPWLVDANGGHHVSDLALPFSREAHGWSSRVDSSSTAQPQAPSSDRAIGG